MPLDFLMTNDVECHSFEDNTLHDSIAKRVEREAMPRLLKLFRRHGVKSTFFFTANFARLSPRSVHMVQEMGHEIGCHGYDHREYYDTLPYREQLSFLKRSKRTIEEISGTRIVSFRAPALRINKDTVRALEDAGFRYDSSAAPQRFDGPLTSGAGNKLQWLTAARNPYFMSYDNPYEQGDSSVVQVPVSAILWPFIGTTLRICPSITYAVQRLLELESMLTGRPLVFLFHPNEALNFCKGETARRGTVFSDNVRHALKMRNLGEPSLALLDKMFSRTKFNYLTVSEISARTTLSGTEELVAAGA